MCSSRYNKDTVLVPKLDSSNNLRLVEAIKKMDTLLSDQDSLAGEFESQARFTPSIRGQKTFESISKSVDKTLNSLDEYGLNPATPTSKNIKFHINSDDEDDEIMGGEYSNMDFGLDDDEPEPNRDFLLASIFSSQRNAVKVPVPKPNPINTNVVPPKQESSSLPQTPTEFRYTTSQ